MSNLILRKAQISDATALIEFNQQLALETESKVLDPETVALGVKNLLLDPSRGFYVVAEQEGRVVGSLMVTFEWSDWRNNFFWWIQSVYVHEDSRRKGVYRNLYEHTRILAEQSGDVCGIRLYVEKENLIAQQTYAQLGMAESRYKIFEAKFGE